MEECGVRLHEVFGMNLFVAHAVDYILAIRLANGSTESRSALVKKFDEIFAIEGARFQNKKFELIDAVNNSLKHIQLDKNRYPKLVDLYGNIAFNSLVQDGKRVLCILEGYRFDYARVVLRPAIKALANWNFQDNEAVLAFASGNVKIEKINIDLDFDDPIDEMIAYANPTCDDCGEASALCACETYTYGGEGGIFTSNAGESFDFDSVMARISG